MFRSPGAFVLRACVSDLRVCVVIRARTGAIIVSQFEDEVDADVVMTNENIAVFGKFIPIIDDFTVTDPPVDEAMPFTSGKRPSEAITRSCFESCVPRRGPRGVSVRSCAANCSSW